jgi:hypothetical protein
MAYTTLLPVSNRNPDKIVTPNSTVPEGVNDARLRLLLNKPEDFADPSCSLTFNVEVQEADGTWRQLAGWVWQGGPVPTRLGVVVGWTATASGLAYFAGRPMRASISQVGSFRWGLEAEIS